MKKIYTAAVFAVLKGLFCPSQSKCKEPTQIKQADGAGYQNMLHKKFADIDTDKDGIISPEEYKAYNDKIEKHRRKIMNQAYKDMDANKDGKVSKSEFLARLNRHKKEISNMSEETILAPEPFSAD